MTGRPDIIVAIDGGGSGCRVALCTADGTRIAQAEGAAANVASDFDAAVGHLAATLETARAQAGLAPADLRRAPAWAGLAGAIEPAICARVAAALPLDDVHVSDDRPTTMAGALGGADGCLAAAGTGSFFGRQVDGRHRFVGGWGLQLGDQASGAWLGRKLLSAVVDWQDGLRPQTPLLEETFAGFRTPAEVAYFSLRATPTDYAAFAPRIVAAAGQGDALGRSLMQEGADWIARCLHALGAEAGETVCLTGGMGPHYAGYLPADLTAALIPPRGTPLDGAILLAADRARRAA
ncbi:BadF/BadG/BcrA/BcrD ATPase family protein [Psychromarinibacter sp. C21-152]|uniref:BadF/BadG/BcrA/BcrD ATPase family protein n=1 Tax=Psychromarinibacter sediminicola TaxID=3033385 RepID=A0AAE3TAG1_9RHOB|nr:BadF/BadG/BcrA/BcrD ATPase family protein [Psychromarinibacter sediminicola]MDF0601585.1 BadF/BadG/BcrA/BcrD ATPase family protein [Psychromarinibacter sediminicola]